MTGASSTANNGDAKEPPDPGPATSNTETMNSVTAEMPQLNKEYLSTFRLLFYYQLELRKKAHKARLNPNNPSIYVNLLASKSVSTYQSQLHIVLLNSTRKESKHILHTLYNFQKPELDGSYPDPLLKAMKIITSLYISYYCPSLKVFSKILTELKKLLPHEEFETIVFDLYQNSWYGIDNEEQIEQMILQLDSYIPPPIYPPTYTSNNQSSSSTSSDSQPVTSDSKNLQLYRIQILSQHRDIPPRHKIQ